MKIISFLILFLLFSCGKHQLFRGDQKSGNLIEVNNEANSNPLIIATTNGNYTEVKAFLDQGEDINGVDERGRSLLMIAVINNNYVIADLLLKEGADLNYRDENGESALEKTTDTFMLKILQNNSSLTEKDWEEYLLKLMVEANQDNQLDTINELKLLFDFGVSPNTADQRASLLMYACNKKLIEIVKFFITIPDLNINLVLGRGSRQYTALDMTRDPILKSLLIENGAKSFKDL